MKQIIEEENNECLDNININYIDIQTELKEILDKIINKINCDKNLIDSCTSLILKNLEKDDDDENENNEKEQNEIKNEKENEDILDITNHLEITKSDSNLSFSDAINNYIFDKSFDNNVNENNCIDLGRISPIPNEEDNLFNVENDYSIFFIPNKKRNKNFEILDNGDYLLLKRKRYENNV